MKYAQRCFAKWQTSGKMTAKHFTWFAQWLSMYPNLLMDYDALDDLMGMFQAWNPKFDNRRFLMAVGFEEEEINDIWGEDY